MKYFKQIIKFYRRLHEQTPSQYNPQAEQQAIALINQAISSQPNTPIQVGDHAGIALYKSQEGNITIKGLHGAKTLTVQDSSGQQGEGYPELVKLLSGGEDGGTKGDSGIDAQTTLPTQPQAKQETRKGILGRALKSLANIIEGMSPGAFNYLNKKLSTDPYASGTRGLVVPLLHQIENHTRMVVGEDGKLSVQTGTNQDLLRDIPIAVQEALEALEKSGPEACIKFKNTFSIVKNEGKNNILIKKSYGDKTEGLLIADGHSRFAKALSEAARAATPGCNAKLSPTSRQPNKCCTLDEPTNILSLGIGHGNSVNIRGKFMEHFHLFAHLTSKCESEGPGSRKCAEIVASLAEAYRDDRQNLIDAFRSVASEINEDEAAIDASDENSVAYSVLRELFGPDAPRKLLLTIAAATRRGLARRKPDIVLDVSKTTQFGQRADVREAWGTREAAVEALRAEGVPDDIIDNLIVRENISEYCSQSAFSECPPDVETKKYFTVSISLKNYISIREKLKMGSVSTNTMDKFYGIKDPEDINEEKSLKKFKEEMEESLGVKITDSVSNIKREVNKLYETIDDLGEIQTTTAKGKKIITNTLNSYVNTFLDQLRKSKTYDEYINSDLVSALKSYQEKSAKGKTKMSEEELKAFQVEIKQYMKIYLESKLMSDKMKSSDPKVRRDARIYIASNVFLAGGASDRSAFIANSLSTGESVTATQNGIIQDTLRDFIDNDEMSDEDIDEMFISKRGKVIAIKSRGKPGTITLEHTFARVKDKTKSGAKNIVVACDGELLQRSSYSPSEMQAQG